MNTSLDKKEVPTGMKAMIFAAGLGTRFKPWTDHHPKALAMVNGRSLLEHTVLYLQKFGIYDLIVNVHHFPEQIKAAIDQSNGWGSQVTISDETGYVLETGGGLVKAAGYFDHRPFLAINVDILTDLDIGQLVKNHLEHQPLITLAVTQRKSSRYFLFDKDSRLSGWRNTATGAERIVRPADPLHALAFSGIHVIDPGIFPLVRRQGKFSLVDLYLDLAPDHLIRGFDHSGGKLVDVGRPESVPVAEKLFA